MIRPSYIRRLSDRRIRRKPFRSVFSKSPIAPPFRWFLTAQEFADARGVKLRTVADWRRKGIDAPPVSVGRKIFYRWDDVTGGDFVATMKRDRAKFLTGNTAAGQKQSIPPLVIPPTFLMVDHIGTISKRNFYV
jgi:hypothetical protein